MIVQHNLARKIVNNTDPGTATVFGGDDLDKVNQYLTGIDQSSADPVTISTETTFNDGKLIASGTVQSTYEDFTRITIPSNPSANKGRVYVKQIDANNDGLFILIKRAGSYVEVQLA